VTTPDPPNATTPEPLSTAELRRNLRASTIDGAAFSANVGLGETYLPAFLLAIGGGEVSSGLVATVPMLAGAVLQLVSPLGVRRIGSLRRWVVLCATIQVLSFLPLIGAALWGRVSPAPIFLIAAVYWGAGMATGPAWNTWIGLMVPAALRARFFARRTRIAQFAALTGLVASGVTLQLGKDWSRPMLAFALIFLAAAIARSTSAVFLRMQSEPQPLPIELRAVAPQEVLRRLRTGRDARLIIYQLLMTICVQVAAPFFTPYMLSELRLSYAAYMTLIGVAYLAKVLALPTLGRFAQRFGSQRLLWVGGLGVIPLAGLWLVSDSFGYLFVIQCLAGCMWAAYELATFLLVFEAIREEERTSLLTLYNFANALVTVAGSLIGGALLATLGRGHDAYTTVFAVSSVARAATLLLLVRVAPIPLRALPLAIRTLALRPSAGSLDAPIIPSIPPTPVPGDNAREAT